MTVPETCAWCHAEVPPSQAHDVRTALEHATMDQRRVYAEAWGEIPALLCARDFNEALAYVNDVLYEQSEHAASSL